MERDYCGGCHGPMHGQDHPLGSDHLNGCGCDDCLAWLMHGESAGAA